MEWIDCLVSYHRFSFYFAQMFLCDLTSSRGNWGLDDVITLPFLNKKAKQTWSDDLSQSTVSPAG